MRNYYREYFEIKNKISENNIIFDKVRKYLIPGTYISATTGNIIRKFDAQSISNDNATFDELVSKNTPFNILLVHMAKKNIMEISKDENSKFCGREVIISSTRKEYKVFSDDSVLTIYTDLKKLRKILDARTLFKQFFHIPAITQCEYENGLVIELRVEKKMFDAVKAFEIFDYYADFLKAANVVQVNDWGKIIDQLNEKFGLNLNANEFNGLPESYTHGDLWSENIMFDGKKYYITDFEHAGRRYFLFDIFMFIYTEYSIKNDDRLMRQYFKGDLDTIFEDIFSAISIPYEKSKRDIYFLAFLGTIYDERWKNANSRMLDFKIRKTLRQFIQRKYYEG